MSQNGSMVIGMSRRESAEQNSVIQSLYARTHSVASSRGISLRNTWLWNPRMFGYMTW
jgi:hypothetical protein